MNYRLAREVYGNTPWMVDGPTFTALMGILNNVKNGVELSLGEEKLNSIHLFEPKSATQIITEAYELNQDAQGDEFIYVVRLNGVITKTGGMSSYGMDYLAAKMKRFDADSRVIGGVIIGDTGGGSSLGMELMQHTIENELKKPVVGLIERAGILASAGYGIFSKTAYIFAESEHSGVGSIGTMLAFSGHANATLDGDNAKQVVIYATKSTKKNKAYTEAIENDNYKLAIDEVLDPANDRFLANVKASRPNVTDEHLDGSMFETGKVVGTLIDAIGTFDDAVNKVIELSQTPKIKINSQKKSNHSTAMTAEELKTQHPAVYQSVFSAGVSAEKDRTGSWLAHSATDFDTVKAGIEGGGEITATIRETLLVKASSVKTLADLKADSATDVIVTEAVTVAKNKSKEELNEVDAFYAELAK